MKVELVVSLFESADFSITIAINVHENRNQRLMIFSEAFIFYNFENAF